MCTLRLLSVFLLTSQVRGQAEAGNWVLDEELWYVVKIGDATAGVLQVRLLGSLHEEAHQLSRHLPRFVRGTNLSQKETVFACAD
jgi:hypothetical protein